MKNFIPKILIFQGSPRNKDNCPNQNGKTQLLAEYIISHISKNVRVDYCDLSVKADTPIIQPCKGCVSTSGGMHCHFPCDCYTAGSTKYPDLLHDQHIYERLMECDGFLVLSPIHWYSVTSQIKTLFDRLVCCNLTLTIEQAKTLGIEKSAKRSRLLEKSNNYNHLLKNHYAGKYGAFFIHGDDGGADYQEFTDEPNKPHLPMTFKKYALNNEEITINNPLHAILPLVWQCRYSGIEVPNDCVVALHITHGLSYSSAMDQSTTNLKSFYLEGLNLFKKLVEHIKKNKI